MPTTQTDAITLLAVLFGAVTAGLLLARPLRRAREARRTTSSAGHAAVAGGLDAEPLAGPSRRTWPAPPRSGIYSTSGARRRW